MAGHPGPIGPRQHIVEDIEVDGGRYHLDIECHGEVDGLMERVRDNFIRIVHQAREEGGWDRLELAPGRAERIQGDIRADLPQGIVGLFRAQVGICGIAGAHIDGVAIDCVEAPAPLAPDYDPTIVSWCHGAESLLPGAHLAFQALTPAQVANLQGLHASMQLQGRSLSVFQRCCAGNLETLVTMISSVRGNAPYLLSQAALGLVPPVPLPGILAADNPVIIRCIDAYARLIALYEGHAGEMDLEGQPPFEFERLHPQEARDLLAASARPLDVMALAALLGGANVDGGMRLRINVRGIDFIINAGHLIERHTAAHYDPRAQPPAVMETTLWPIHMDARRVFSILERALEDIITQGGGRVPPAYYGQAQAIKVVPGGTGDEYECEILIDHPPGRPDNLVVTFYPVKGPGVVKIGQPVAAAIHRGFEAIRLASGHLPQYP